MPVPIRKVFVSGTGGREVEAHQHHKLQASAIAYSYMPPNGYLVVVSKPTIDDLTLTIPVLKDIGCGSSISIISSKWGCRIVCTYSKRVSVKLSKHM